jgi:GT2 family glycosyltransferase
MPGPGEATPGAADNLPLVTVGMAHYNLGRHLPEALASLAAQTYPHLEVLVIDDGSTDADSRAVFEEMSSRYLQFRFLRQANAGIGATRNRALREARGTFFIPMDADNIARQDMVERFVAAMCRNPNAAAMTCYFLAFQGTEDLAREHYQYAYRPTGGPHVLAAIRNVYGDANAIYRTAAFRAVGGFETDRDTSCEDWEAFVKLVHAGGRVEVVPDHLFFYRHRETGFSRVTSSYRNHQRVLRQFDSCEHLPVAEKVLLWRSLIGFQQRLQYLDEQHECLRYQIADRLHTFCRRWPSATRAVKRVLRSWWKSAS